MRKLILLSAFVAVSAVAFVAGFTTSTSASGNDQPSLSAGWDMLFDGPGRGGPGGPGRGGPGRGGPGGPGSAPECLAVIKAVHDACPCNGPDGNGWADHAAYVECATNAANGAVSGGASQECADKVIEHATNSKVGEPGFECKARGHKPGGRKPGGPHPEPTPGGGI